MTRGGLGMRNDPALQGIDVETREKMRQLREQKTPR